MKSEQVDQALHQKFVTEDARLVFWHDQDGEFAEYVQGDLPETLSAVSVLRVKEKGGLSAKLHLEREDPTGKYLVYSDGERPKAEEDWLLDMRLYSAEFHADIHSIWLQELGLSRLSLRDHIKARATFLGNKDRRKKLARLISSDDDEACIDRKMMAVLVGSSVGEPFDVLRALYHGHVQSNRFDLSAVPEVVQSFEKMDLLTPFWALMESTFGYAVDEPTVAGLLRRLFVAELFHQTNGADMPSLTQHHLPPKGRRNAVVFLTQWRDSNSNASSYAAAAASVFAEQKIGQNLATLGLDVIKSVFTFWEAEQRVLSALKERLLTDAEMVDVEFVAGIVSARKAGHWLSGHGSDLPERRAIAKAYDAIVAANELFALHNSNKQALSFTAPADLITAYQKDLYRFDQLYRHFCSHAKPALSQGWDLLKTLAEQVERVYDQGFLQPFGVEWSRLLDEGFLSEWTLEGLPAQQDFYAKKIHTHLAESDRKRAFVIISDAFRYEAAKEFTRSLNGQYRMDAQLSSMLGVLPSYTALGMASLLPRETLSYSPTGDVLVDGKSPVGTEGRNKQLATVEGMACQAKDLVSMKVEQAREFTHGKRVVYIYHNVIDAHGDSASTEDDTFDAVSDCIAELVTLVQFCVNKLNAAKVWVTADHGFLFQQEEPDQTDKTVLGNKPTHAKVAKKRYIIGPDLGSSSQAHHGSIAVTAGAGGEMEFWIPRAANRFHFSGGARFIHGGAMPQEVIIPVVTVTHLRGKDKEASRAEKVSLQVLGNNHKITTPTYRFEIIQTEAVGQRRKPITIHGAVYEGSRPVTSVETLTFDSTSDSMDERRKSLRLELQGGTFDKTTPYKLILRDAETDAEVQSIPVVIDRSFDDDF